MEKEIKVAIIEDDSHIRSVISEYLNQQKEMECLIQSHSVEHFFETVSPKARIHVLIQDINLPGMSGLEAIKKVKSTFPKTEIVMFSIYNDSSRIFKAFCAGASGYLIKNTKLPDMKKAVLDIYQGKAAMSPSIAKKVIDHFKPKKIDNELTKKENMVVQLLTEGLSYKMIADRMQVSPNTTQSHIKNIYRKLHINSKAELITRKLQGEI